MYVFKKRWKKKNKYGMIPQNYNRSTNVAMEHNVGGLCVVALRKNLKLTTTLDRAITQNPCYVK